jgi:hypothetical protein
MDGVGQAQIENLNAISTTNFAESSLAVLLAFDQNVLPSAVDLYLIGKDYYNEYSLLAEKLTLAQSVDLALPDIYRVVVPKSAQMAEKDIAGVQATNLTAFTQLL